MSERKHIHPSDESHQPIGQQDTAALIRECLAGSRQAQKVLYDKFAPTAYGIIKRYTSHKEMADEILNDAFFKIFTKLDQYSASGSFEGWMYRIVVHTVADHLKKYIREKERTDTGEVEDMNVQVSGNIVQGLSYKELLGMVHQLPDTHRAVFNLFVFEQYSHKDIATLLNISEGNSRWYLNNARKKLMEKINNINDNR